MRYFTPQFQIATLIGEQKNLLSKIGGIPWGLPIERWPHCCGEPQKLLAQLCHEPPMLDLGAPGAVLHLFQCLGCFGIDECGCNAFVIDQSELGDGLVQTPGYDDQLDQKLIGEFRISGWKEGDDGIPASRFPEFFNERKLWALQEEFQNIDWFDFQERTRFGGTPRWTGNGPGVFPEPPFEFLFQLDNYLFLQGPPPKPDEAGCTVLELNKENKWNTANPIPSMRRMNAPWTIMHEPPKDYHAAEYTNLGSDGTAYVFVDRSRKPYTYKWYWNR